MGVCGANGVFWVKEVFRGSWGVSDTKGCFGVIGVCEKGCLVGEKKCLGENWDAGA